jgi:hypothetical protein
VSGAPNGRGPRRPGQSRESDDADTAEDREPSYREQFPENFYTGLIVFLDRVRGRGAVRTYSGKEIPFEFPHVTLIGAPIGGRMPGIQLLNEGDTVGFDVGWTSKGLRITTIRPAKSRTG